MFSSYSRRHLINNLIFLHRGGVLRILLPLALVGAAAGVTASVLLGLQPPKKKTPVPPPPLPKKW